ncbi:diiron oxygenase [Sphingomonas parva]|nr:diiron oxygenase [Sphingomonas parva]
MYHHNFTYGAVLDASARAAWRIEDILPPGAKLDFNCDFMPEALARTDAAPGVDSNERRILNHIRGHEYLSIFGLVEEFILPFVLDHARPQLDGDDLRVRALLGFAGEEAKHIQLFRQFHALFTASFGTPCEMIGPAQAIAAEILRHDVLAVALLILHIEWMSQRHYLESIRDDAGVDPLFKSLLKHHWMEEAQHARLDTLMVEALAAGRNAESIARAVDEYLEMGAFLDGGLASQTRLNLDAFEAATGRALDPDHRATLQAQQHQALRWSYIGSGMTHPKFQASLAALGGAAQTHINQVAPAFY